MTNPFNSPDQAPISPIDRLVRLIAEIEVGRYLQEIKPRGDDHEPKQPTGGGVRPLQR